MSEIIKEEQSRSLTNSMVVVYKNWILFFFLPNIRKGEVFICKFCLKKNIPLWWQWLNTIWNALVSSNIAWHLIKCYDCLLPHLDSTLIIWMVNNGLMRMSRTGQRWRTAVWSPLGAPMIHPTNHKPLFSWMSRILGFLHRSESVWLLDWSQ